MQLKRLWDTEGKKIVFAEWPSGHECQVWTDENGDPLPETVTWALSIVAKFVEE